MASVATIAAMAIAVCTSFQLCDLGFPGILVPNHPAQLRDRHDFRCWWSEYCCYYFFSFPFGVERDVDNHRRYLDREDLPIQTDIDNIIVCKGNFVRIYAIDT